MNRGFWIQLKNIILFKQLFKFIVFIHISFMKMVQSCVNSGKLFSLKGKLKHSEKLPATNIFYTLLKWLVRTHHSWKLRKNSNYLRPMWVVLLFFTQNFFDKMLFPGVFRWGSFTSCVTKIFIFSTSTHESFIEIAIHAKWSHQTFIHSDSTATNENKCRNKLFEWMDVLKAN